MFIFRERYTHARQREPWFSRIFTVIVSRKSYDPGAYSAVIYMKFSKTVGNSWHNVLDQLQPGIPGETVQERHGGREELHTSAATGQL